MNLFTRQDLMAHLAASYILAAALVCLAPSTLAKPADIPASQAPQPQPTPVPRPFTPPFPGLPIATITPTEETTKRVFTEIPNDFNKEVIDYNDKFMSALSFVQSEKQASPSNGTANPVLKFLGMHHNNEETYQYLKELNEKYPKITRLYSIGKSVEGRDLWVIEITEQPGEHVLLKPEFKYIANIHGNEVVGRELLLHLARLLVENYQDAVEDTKTDPKQPTTGKFVMKLLKETRIHILPAANPDGYARSDVACMYERVSKRGRINANNVDLNRNFPDPIFKNKPDANTQPETRAIMQWSLNTPFVLSGSLHGGALVASYPYDGAKSGGDKGEMTPTPDDDVFRNLALAYSTAHENMSNGRRCYDECTTYHEEDFPGGITNGAGWYPLYGGMQDWVYESANSMEVTIEVGCNQYPPADKLAEYWQFNKRALMNFMRQVHRGVKGIVKDSITGKLIPNATIRVDGRTHDTRSTAYGDYYRILMPGRYTISFEHENYEPNKAFIEIDNTMPKILNITLTPIGAPKSTEPPSIFKPDQDASGTEKPTAAQILDTSGHSLQVTTLILSVIIILILLSMSAAYVIQKRRLRRQESLELQPTTRSTGISLTSQQPSGSSSQHLSP